MHIAYVSAANPVNDTGGSEITARRWLQALQDHGATVSCITKGTERNTETEFDFVTKIDARRPVNELQDIIDQREPDVIITQLGWCDIALKIANERGIKTVLLMLVVGGAELDLSDDADTSPTEIVVPSAFAQRRVQEIWQRDATIVYQPIDFDYYTAPSKDPRSITMINPIVKKGGNVFKELAARFPDQQFLTKRGWMHDRGEGFSWQEQPFRVLEESLGIPFSLPEDTRFGESPNTTVVRNGDIRDIYARTKLLLVPSQWEETFGRVVIEAMWNRIPVIASKRGGLPEACGDAGWVVEDYNDVDAWEETVSEALGLSATNLDQWKSQSRERAQRYRNRQPEFENNFISLVESTARVN